MSAAAIFTAETQRTQRKQNVYRLHFSFVIDHFSFQSSENDK